MSIAELTALGDWDPDGINTLHGPFANDHRGDLSRWVVDSDGNTTNNMVVARIKTSELHGRALVVHAGGDTDADTPPFSWRWRCLHYLRSGGISTRPL